MERARAQLPLFQPPPLEPVVDPEVVAIARALSPRLRLGTSSFAFPGWSGLVYRGTPSQDELVASGLAAYARHPLFGTVSIDRSYYEPLSLDAWRAYGAALPPAFSLTAKMWSEITRPRFAQHPKLGARAGQPNPRYLDVTLASEILRAYADGLGDAAGPMLLQFPPLAAPSSQAFCDELDAFLKALPSTGVRLAVEIRNGELLTPRYARTLREHGVAHTFTYFSTMPPLEKQIGIAALLDAPYLMARLNLPPGTEYAAQKQAFAPFDRIVAPQPRMRAEVARLCRHARERDLDCYVIANNKAEGSAPLTLLAIAKDIAAAAPR